MPVNPGRQLLLELLAAGKELPDDAAGLGPIWDWLYQPDPDLGPHIEKLQAYVDKPERERSDKDRKEAGDLMEQIALLAFQSIVGWRTVASYESAGFEIDLYIDGSSPYWLGLMEILRLPDVKRRGIVIECKATKEKADEPVFSRFCCILEQNFGDVAGLGVFFTLAGGTGFEKVGILEAAKLRQVVHRARTDVPIILFTWDEIKELATPGSLLALIHDKIRAILTFMADRGPTTLVAASTQLPKHLLPLVKEPPTGLVRPKPASTTTAPLDPALPAEESAVPPPEAAPGDPAAKAQGSV